METQSKLKEVVKKEIKKIKENKKCKHDIFDFACVIAEYNKARIPSKVLRKIQIGPYHYIKTARMASTV
jgi:hypothetical protein